MDWYSVVAPKARKHKVLLVPACDKMPVATLKNIIRLAREGATVIFEHFPQEVPGYNDRRKGNQELKALIAGVSLTGKEQLQNSYYAEKMER